MRGSSITLTATLAAIGTALAVPVAGGGTDQPSPDAKPRKRSELPGGGRRIFPDRRVVAFYGAPQHRNLGVLGIGSPDRAAARLRRQARPYRAVGRPVLPGFELVATIALAGPGRDGLYRGRQPARIIDRYLRATRRHRAILSSTCSRDAPTS